MVAGLAFVVLAAVSRLTLAHKAHGTPTVALDTTNISPQQTAEYFSAISLFEEAIYPEHKSLFDAVVTVLPQSAYVDTTEPAFNLGSFVGISSIPLAGWVTLLPSSIQATYMALETDIGLEWQKIAKSILAETGASQTAPTSTPTSTGHHSFEGNVHVSGKTPSPTGFTTMPAKSNTPSPAAKTSTNHAAPTEGVRRLQMTGMALGAVAAVIAAL